MIVETSNLNQTLVRGELIHGFADVFFQAIENVSSCCTGYVKSLFSGFG
jgi:hypothetical protein